MVKFGLGATWHTTELMKGFSVKVSRGFRVTVIARPEVDVVSIL